MRWGYGVHPFPSCHSHVLLAGISWVVRAEMSALCQNLPEMTPLRSPPPVGSGDPSERKRERPDNTCGHVIIHLGTDPSPLAQYDNRVQAAFCHPRQSLAGIHPKTGKMDSRQKHAGMTRKIDTGGYIRKRPLR